MSGEPDLGWSGAHHGIDPSGVLLLRPWLLGVRALARPLVALRVAPDAVTLAGGLVAVAVPVLARRAPAAAVLCVVASGVLDALDGEVARASGRVSAHGRALDSAVDRVSEACGWVALARVGVPVPAAVLLGVVSTGMERARARRGHHGRLTVWERPTRTVLVVAGLAAAGEAPLLRVRAVPPAAAPRMTAAIGVLLALVGATQLARGFRAEALRPGGDPSS